MTAWIRRLSWRLVDILSSLALHLKKGYAGVSHIVAPRPANQPEAASYYLGQSARHFREFYRNLFGAFRVAARRPKTRANAVPALVKSVAGCKHPAWPQSPAQTSRFEKHSCPESDAKNPLASNDENAHKRGIISLTHHAGGGL